MTNPMIAIYETLGGPWLLAASVEAAFDDAAEQLADEARYENRYGGDD